VLLAVLEMKQLERDALASQLAVQVLRIGQRAVAFHSGR
jgi:hypothetical protein